MLSFLSSNILLHAEKEKLCNFLSRGSREGDAGLMNNLANEIINSSLHSDYQCFAFTMLAENTPDVLSALQYAQDAVDALLKHILPLSIDYNDVVCNTLENEFN